MYRIGEEEIEEVAKVIRCGQLFRHGDPATGHMQEVVRFEKEWAEKIGVKYAVLNSGGGTSSLICSLVGLGIGPGDEVIVPAFTFMATAAAVLAVGAIPVVAEIDNTLAIDPNDIEKKINPNTRAIIPVHMFGMPANMKKICEIAKKHNLKVLEDACQADGGSFKGKRLGSWGDAGAFSFNYYKAISCGDGGAFVTNDQAIYERALIYHDSGIGFRPIAKDLHTPVFTGLQMRASEIMGAVMRIQLQRLDGILADLRRVKKIIMSELADVSGFCLAESNDIEGDCGIAVPLQFESESKTKAFSEAPGVQCGLLINSGRHIYCNWEPVMEKRAGAHKDLNPYTFPQNQGLRLDCKEDECPVSMDIIRRTAIIDVSPDWTDEQILERTAAYKKAAQNL